MTDPLDVLHSPIPHTEPDPDFARVLRSRLERALLDPPEAIVTTTQTHPATDLLLHALTPYLAVVDARAALDFYVTAFGASLRGAPIVMDDGRIGHAEIALGDSVLMLADEFPEIGLAAPANRGGASQSLRLEVADPDEVVARAVAAGATLERPVTDSPHGRGGVVLDPSGHRWMVSREAPTARPGDLVYASLWTPDAVAAQHFYGEVLGVAPHLHATSGPATAMLCYATAGIDAAVARVRAAGGAVDDPQDRPYGRVADAVDDQGIPFALHEGPAPPAHEIDYVELRVPDATRARAFYGTVLGWGFEPGGAPGYWHPHRADGGFPSPMAGLVDGHAAAVVVPTFAVDDLDAATAAVEAGGGTVAAAPDRDHGRTAECTDDQGAAFALRER